MKPIISTSIHLAWETIQAYLENKLSRAETHAVEKHLLECPLCSEAVEGLSQAPLAENEKNIAELWKKIDGAVQDKKKKRFFIYKYRYWAVAASLILALGLVLVLLLTNPQVESGGNDQLAQKNIPAIETPKDENADTNVTQDLDETVEKPILQEKTAVETDRNQKKSETSNEETPIKQQAPILEEKMAVLADVFEEKPVVEEKTEAEKKSEEIEVLEKTAVSEEKRKTDANNIVKTPENADTDLALRLQKEDRKKQNSAKIAEKSEIQKDVLKKEEQVALDSLLVKKEEETEQIIEKKSVILPYEIEMAKPNLSSLLDSLKVDFAKIEYKTIPQISLLDDLAFATDDRSQDKTAKVETIEEVKKEQTEEAKPQELAKTEPEEVKTEPKVEQRDKIEDNPKIEISPKAKDSLQVQTKVELPAEAPVSPEGGWDKFQEYLKANLQYPEDAKRNGVQGMVRIELLIDEDGKIKDLEIKRGLIESCNQEALRLVKNYKWLAARQNGSAIEERITVKISFE